MKRIKTNNYIIIVRYFIDRTKQITIMKMKEKLIYFYEVKESTLPILLKANSFSFFQLCSV